MNRLCSQAEQSANFFFVKPLDVLTGQYLVGGRRWPSVAIGGRRWPSVAVVEISHWCELGLRYISLQDPKTCLFSLDKNYSLKYMTKGDVMYIIDTNIFIIHQIYEDVIPKNGYYF